MARRLEKMGYFVKYTIIHSYIRIFNRLLASCSYPERWVDGVITPIFKSSSKTDSENYRKVTVLPALGKLSAKKLSEI